MNLSILLFTLPKIVAVLSSLVQKWEEINNDGEISLGEWYAFGLAGIMAIGDVLGFTVKVPSNLPSSVGLAAKAIKDSAIDQVDNLFPDSPTKRYSGK